MLVMTLLSIGRFAYRRGEVGRRMGVGEEERPTLQVRSYGGPSEAGCAHFPQAVD